MWRRLLAVTTALLFVFTAACDSAPDIELTYGIGPIEIAVDKNLDVSVSLGARFVTPIGEFGISGGQTIGLNTPEIEEQRRGKLTLILRMTVKGKRVAKVFVIESGQKLRLEISGKTVQDYEKYGEQTTVTIDAAPGTTIKISPVRTIPPPTTTPTPVYRLAYENREIRISTEGQETYVGIDLDKAKTVDDLDGMDLQWQSGGYFEAKPDRITTFGYSSTTRPKPATCIADARAKAAGQLEPSDDMRTGQAFCAVTAEGNPSWLKLVSMNGEGTALTFRASYWKATTAEALPEDLTRYELAYRNQEVRVPNPTSVYGGPDLDLPENVDGSDEQIDILWYDGIGLQAGYDSSFGNSSASRRSAKACLADAHGKAVGKVAVEDLRVGQAFCVETDQGNVAWLVLAAKGGDSEFLLFRATLWRPAA
jgi:hypothetical protein